MSLKYSKPSKACHLQNAHHLQNVRHLQKDESMSLLSSKDIKAEALRLGFSACGMAPADAVDESTSSFFRQWLNNGYQAEMSYMQNYEDKRLDPRLLVEGARTVISVALNYYPETKIPENEYQIAWYAYGKDYHDVMKTKLNALLEFIQQGKASVLPTSSNTSFLISDASLSFPDASLTPSQTPLTPSKTPFTPPLTNNARAFCDTAPVLERYWAWRAGLGWIGKNTLLLIPQAGSYFFLSEIIIDIPADHYDSPQKSRCGSCTRCQNACPTKAIEAPYLLNSARCLSYLTIEHRGDIPSNLGLKMGKKIYGCDDCQRVCPWNRFSTPCRTPEFFPAPALLNMRKEDWHRLTEEQYRILFKGSAVKRAKYSGLRRNIDGVKATKP